MHARVQCPPRRGPLTLARPNGAAAQRPRRGATIEIRPRSRHPWGAALLRRALHVAHTARRHRWSPALRVAAAAGPAALKDGVETCEAAGTAVRLMRGVCGVQSVRAVVQSGEAAAAARARAARKHEGRRFGGAGSPLRPGANPGRSLSKRRRVARRAPRRRAAAGAHVRRAGGAWRGAAGSRRAAAGKRAGGPAAASWLRRTTVAHHPAAKQLRVRARAQWPGRRRPKRAASGAGPGACRTALLPNSTARGRSPPGAWLRARLDAFASSSAALQGPDSAV